MAIGFGSTTSLTIQRHLAQHTRDVGRSMQRLSSGLRITSAADDPAGIAIGKRLMAKERSLDQAVRNAGDGVSMLAVAEGALDESSSLLVRIRELAIQSANGSLGASERSVLNDEAQALIAEIDRIAEVTEFNGVRMLDGSTGNVEFQTGANAGDTLVVDGADVRASELGDATALTDIDLSTASGAADALAVVDVAIDQVSNVRAEFGTAQGRAESRIRSLRNASENTAAARSRIMDADIAAETSNLTRSIMLQQLSTSLLAQANQQQRIVLTLLESTFR